MSKRLQGRERGDKRGGHWSRKKGDTELHIGCVGWWERRSTSGGKVEVDGDGPSEQSHLWVGSEVMVNWGFLITFIPAHLSNPTIATVCLRYKPNSHEPSHLAPFIHAAFLSEIYLFSPFLPLSKHLGILLLLISQVLFYFRKTLVPLMNIKSIVSPCHSLYFYIYYNLEV